MQDPYKETWCRDVVRGIQICEGDWFTLTDGVWKITLPGLATAAKTLSNLTGVAKPYGTPDEMNTFLEEVVGLFALVDAGRAHGKRTSGYQS